MKSARTGDRQTCAAKSAELGRPEVTARLRKACSLAQGFCIVLLIMTLIVLATACVLFSRQLTEGAAEPYGEEGSPSVAQRLFVETDVAVEIRGLSNATFDWAFFRDAPGAAGGGGGTVLAHQLIDAPSRTGYITERAALPQLVWAVSACAISIPLFLAGMHLFKRIARTGKPFRVDRARELGRMAWLIIALSFVPGVLNLACVAIGIAVLPDTAVAANVSFFNYMLLACGFLLLALARAFEYGCILQAQDDGLV